MKTYTIKPGFSFRIDDAGATRGAGERIELADDVATLHAEKVDLVEEGAEQTTAPAVTAAEPE